MNNSKNNNTKYITKVAIIVIVVIINIIAIMGVITTVGSAIKALKSDIDAGKIYDKEVSSTREYENKLQEGDANFEYDTESEMEGDLELNIDMQSILKLAISDESVRKSLILMIIALILLAGAIYILVKLK